VDLLVEDRPDLPHITHRPSLNPLSHPECSLHLLLLTTSSCSSSTRPACSIVLGRQRSLGKGWVDLGKQLVIVTLLLLLLEMMLLWMMLLWVLVLLLGKMVLLLRMGWWLLVVPLLLVEILYMLLLLLMKLLLMMKLLLLLLLELHLLLLTVLLLLLGWVRLERSLLCLLPLLKLHTEAIFRGGFRRFFVLLKLAGSIDGSRVLVSRCPRVLTMVSQPCLLLLLDLLLKSSNRSINLVLLGLRRLRPRMWRGRNPTTSW